jgi:hypothetical protein
MENEEPGAISGILHSQFSIFNSAVPVEEPGVLATLSRWRSRVQIPSGTLDGTVRKPAKRPSSNLGDRLWVQLPPVSHASAGHWRAQAAVTRPQNAVQVQLLPDALPARSSFGEDAGLSRRIEGFDSPTGGWVVAR